RLYVLTRPLPTATLFPYTPLFRSSPGLGEQIRINIVDLTIDVDIAARKLSAQQGAPMTRHRVPQLVDMGVLRPTQHGYRQHRLEIRGIRAAAVRRITYQRYGFDGRRDQTVRFEIRICEFHSVSLSCG